MWSMEVTFSVQTVPDLERLAEVAGNLVEELEAAAGDTGPVVTGHYRADRPILIVSMDIAAEEPTRAVSDALMLLNRVAKTADISLGTVHAISLNIADDVEIASELTAV